MKLSAFISNMVVKNMRGEKVSQLEHMVQSAQIAAHNGFDDDVVLAAFLHDIGHICVSAFPSNSMDGFGIVDHEKIGADYLRNERFSQKVAKLVESHVAAKRYLTFKYPSIMKGYLMPARNFGIPGWKNECSRSRCL